MNTITVCASYRKMVIENNMKKILSKLFGEKKNSKPKKFDPKIRIDAEKLSEKEKMDKGFNGKTLMDYHFE